MTCMKEAERRFTVFWQYADKQGRTVIEVELTDDLQDDAEDACCLVQDEVAQTLARNDAGELDLRLETDIFLKVQVWAFEGEHLTRPERAADWAFERKEAA